MQPNLNLKSMIRPMALDTTWIATNKKKYMYINHNKNYLVLCTPLDRLKIKIYRKVYYTYLHDISRQIVYLINFGTNRPRLI